jgi:hypothetical protein
MYDYRTVGVNLSSYLGVWHLRLMPSDLKPTPSLDTVCYSSFFFIVLLFICAYKAWAISPPSLISVLLRAR